MRRIDELFTAWPFLGSRRMAAMLQAEGLPVNRKRVQRLMRKMGIAALGPKPSTTQAGAGPQDLSLSAARHDDRPAEPGVGGRHHLSCRSAAAFSISWRSSTGRAVRFWRGGCRTRWTPRSASLRSKRRWRATAGRRSSTPTRAASSPVAAFTGALGAAGIKISMDGRGRWMDNVFIERLWRSLKHEDIYLKGYADGREAKAGIATGSPSTTIAAFIRRSAIARRWRSGATRASNTRCTAGTTARMRKSAAAPQGSEPIDG